MIWRKMMWWVRSIESNWIKIIMRHSAATLFFISFLRPTTHLNRNIPTDFHDSAETGILDSPTNWSQQKSFFHLLFHIPWFPSCKNQEKKRLDLTQSGSGVKKEESEREEILSSRRIRIMMIILHHCMTILVGISKEGWRIFPTHQLSHAITK